MARNLTWKQMRMRMVKDFYGKYVPEFEGHEDDRKIFCNTYRMILDALEELPDEPAIFTKCAINNGIGKEMEMMDRIIYKFCPEVKEDELNGF